jgi:hypothetical protein
VRGEGRKDQGCCTIERRRMREDEGLTGCQGDGTGIRCWCLCRSVRRARNVVTAQPGMSCSSQP